MTKRVKLVVGLVSMIIVSVLASGCNTVKGIGKDFEEGGKAIQNLVE